MSAALEVLTGGRSGLRFPLAGPIVTIGRGADCHLRLDPDVDLAVSSRHAVIRRSGEGWSIRDLGSRNGTLVNGVPLAGDLRLGDGDRIVLGGGPELRFLADASVVAGSSGADAAVAAAAAGPAERRRHPLPLVIGVLALLVAATATAFVLADRNARRSWGHERTAMQQRLDSLRRENERVEASLRGQVTGLADALRASRGDVERLRQDLTRLEATGKNGKEAAGLRERLQAASSTLERQQRAASLDFGAIQRANRRAVALLYVEYDDGKVATATAFAVRPDATMITNRHAVYGEDGRARPRRMAVQFSDSEQIWPARLLGVAEGLDLAVVKVDNITGNVPTVRGFNTRGDTLRSGAPLALIGFPHGGAEPTQLPSGGSAVRPVLGAGTLWEDGADQMRVQGYGAAGASGTPIFDGTGEVVGVLFGGRQEEKGQMLYAVPAAAAVRLLAGIHGVSSP